MIKDALGLPGGLPIKVGNDTIGGVGVAGAPGGNGDVACSGRRQTIAARQADSARAPAGQPHAGFIQIASQT